MLRRKHWLPLLFIRDGESMRCSALFPLVVLVVFFIMSPVHELNDTSLLSDTRHDIPIYKSPHFALGEDYRRGPTMRLCRLWNLSACKLY